MIKKISHHKAAHEKLQKTIGTLNLSLIASLATSIIIRTATSLFKCLGWLSLGILLIEDVGWALAQKKIGNPDPPPTPTVLFEGYSKVSLNGVHVGFYIQRYTLNPKKKELISQSLLKTNEIGGDLVETLKATCNPENFRPISYSYSVSKQNKVIKTISGSLKKDKFLIAIKINDPDEKEGTSSPSGISEGSGGSSLKTEKPKVISEKKSLEITKGLFLSTFLTYVMVKTPQGIRPSINYEYQAIAEEEGSVFPGVANVISQETYKSFDVYRISNEFPKSFDPSKKTSPFVTLVNEKGEVFSTQAQDGLMTELVALPSQATERIALPMNQIKSVFQSLPEGMIQPLAATLTKKAGRPPLTPGKGFGIPGGKGLILKSGGEMKNQEIGSGKTSP